MDKKLNIQEVSSSTGLSTHTLRYYEKIGLLRKVSRSSTGYREYSERDVAWIEFLVRLRETGMPIQQMIQFANLRYQGEETIPQRRAMLENLEREVLERIESLHRSHNVIRLKIKIYKEWESNGK